MVLPVGLEVVIIEEIKIIRKVNFHGLQIMLTYYFMLIIKPVKHSKLAIEQVFQLFQRFFL